MYPNIIYCAIVWGFSPKTKFTAAQKKTIRINEGVSYRDHSEPIYDRLKVLEFVNFPTL